MSATLVFPVSTPEGRSYLDAALARGERVVAASCDATDPTGGAAPWARLPLVHEPDFLNAFLDLTHSHGVTRIVAGAHTVHAALAEMLRSHGVEHVRIANRSALEQEFERWDDLFARAARWRETIATLLPGVEPPPRAFLAGTLRIAFDLFGESYDDKLAGLLACLLDAPEGDLVEIGALFGRSASVLLIGRELGGRSRRLFVFDAWCAEIGLQQDLPPAMQRYTRGLELERVADAFEASFAALAPAEALAVYRAPSLIGRRVYGGEADGEHLRLMRWRPPLRPRGRIALLHIDGNHDEACAAEDIDLWSPLVAPGGWVVVDDYCWRYGDGPRRAGDALLSRWSGEAARSFVLGGSLFLQRG